MTSKADKFINHLAGKYEELTKKKYRRLFFDWGMTENRIYGKRHVTFSHAESIMRSGHFSTMLKTDDANELINISYLDVVLDLKIGDARYKIYSDFFKSEKS